MKKVLSFMVIFAVVFTLLAVPLTASAVDTSSKAGTVSIKNGSLNVRKSASTKAEVIYSLKKDTFITLISKSGDWWKVEYSNGKYGFCHSDYIKAVSSTTKTVKLTSGTLNVRSGAGTSYSRIGSLANGKVVIELSSSNGWSKILFNGTKTGYVSSKYLTDNKTVSYPKIALKVPSFKQYDSRWAKTKIGSSGKTIEQIGCATTAIAMIESFRKGTTIYPDAMSKKLSYTSSGNVYWPSDYTVVTTNTNYLSKIYDQLKKGKAVLLGAKNKAGSQHWVVITGYSGSDSLSIGNFTVNDPGSSTRTTLKAFLSLYPNFYKYFYYSD
ncbi:MAG: hypothetical protein E7551_01750 [Ruminococcaceae bacterium]|nr:hypothetical protein [Oscillospiraceae bacterium]